MFEITFSLSVCLPF